MSLEDQQKACGESANRRKKKKKSHVVAVLYDSSVDSEETFNTETKIAFNNFNQLHF